MSHRTTPATRRAAGPAPARRGAAATTGALVTNLALLLVGGAAGASFTVPPRGGAGGPVHVGVGPVVVSTLLPLVAGLLVTAAVARRTPRAVTAVRALAALATGASLAFPLAAATDAGTRVLLALMHLVVGGAYLAATRDRRPVSASVGPVPLAVGGHL